MTTREMQAGSSDTPPRQNQREYTKYNTKAVVSHKDRSVHFEYRTPGEKPDVFLIAYGDNALHALKNLKRCIKNRCEELAI